MWGKLFFVLCWPLFLSSAAAAIAFNALAKNEISEVVAALTLSKVV
jgi:hypothetical protein